MVYGGLDLIAMSNALSLRLDSFQAIKSLSLEQRQSLHTRFTQRAFLTFAKSTLY